jgi:cell division control protein 7
MYNLLCCLENIHKNGIVHRDLKPDNFLYDINNNKCLLIDFGLSEYEMEETLKKSINIFDDEDLKIIIDIQKSTGLRHRIGTRGFLAPEIIFNAKLQTRAVDIWAAGVIFLGFITKRMPVFNLNRFSKIQDETIKEIIPLIIVFGKEKIIEIAQKYSNYFI